MKLYNLYTKRLICVWLEIIALTLFGWVVAGPIGNMFSDVLPALPLDVTPERISNVCTKIGLYCCIFGGIQITLLLSYWCCRHKLHKGLIYALKHAWYSHRITKALIEAGAGYTISEENCYVKPPKVLLEFSDNCSQGLVRIKNHVKYDNKLETINLSPAVGQFIIDSQYISDDGNYYCYQFSDSRLDQRIVFRSYPDLIDFVEQYGEGKLMLDARNQVTLSNQLVVGPTGSGKSYLLYYEILQLLSWQKVPPVIYCADPKLSGLRTLCSVFAPERTSSDVTEIIDLLTEFYNKMNERKKELFPRLQEKLDADYSYFQDPSYPANVFIFDEFTSFQATVNTMDKATRDKVAMLLRNICLQGRALGFFLWIAMQKSDSNDLPTSIRDSLVLKIAVGNCPSTTYLTIFEKSSDLPVRNYKCGQGLFSCQGLTVKPMPVTVPTLHFDILHEVSQYLSSNCNL